MAIERGRKEEIGGERVLLAKRATSTATKKHTHSCVIGKRQAKRCHQDPRGDIQIIRLMLETKKRKVKE